MAGKYKIATGDAVCTNCVTGKYSVALGATSDVCQTCPPNSNAAEASDIQTDCTCNSGYTGDDGDTCNACVAGKYKIAMGDAVCTNCVAGQYSVALGATKPKKAQQGGSSYSTNTRLTSMHWKKKMPKKQRDPGIEPLEGMTTSKLADKYIVKRNKIRNQCTLLRDQVEDGVIAYLDKVEETIRACDNLLLTWKTHGSPLGDRKVKEIMYKMISQTIDELDVMDVY